MTTAAAAYPIRVHARLDAGLSRRLWLVKVVPGDPALRGARRPVLRWTWRVACYTYGALATDRYPPFSAAVAVS